MSLFEYEGGYPLDQRLSAERVRYSPNSADPIVSFKLRCLKRDGVRFRVAGMAMQSAGHVTSAGAASDGGSGLSVAGVSGRASSIVDTVAPPINVSAADIARQRTSGLTTIGSPITTEAPSMGTREFGDD